MAVLKQTVEIRRCDVCEDGGEGAQPHTVGFDGLRWQIDLCPRHFADIRSEVDRIGAYGRPAVPRASRQQREAEWSYLMALGFTRHRGRRTSAEQAALDELRLVQRGAD